MACTLGACENDPEPDATLVSTAMIKGFDPVNAGDVYSSGAQANVYDCLYEYHYLKRPYELQPMLADGMPEISPDGLTYTIRMKKGVLFQDNPCFPGGKGREVTAHDLEWCFKRLMGVPSSTGAWLYQGRLVGLDAWAERCQEQIRKVYDRINENYPFEHPSMDAIVAEEVEGVRALDDHTIQFTLTEPYPQFQWTLAMIYACVYPKEALEHWGMDFQTHPVGTGPYIVDEYWPFDLRVRLRRNPTYRDDVYPSDGTDADREQGLLADAGRRVPILDRVDIRIITNSSPRWLQFLQGEIDRVETEKDIWDEAMTVDGKLRPDVAARGVRVEISKKADIAYTGFNMEDAIIGAPAGEKGKKIRQAICLAYDQAGWIKVMRNGFWAIPADGPVPPDLAGRVEVPNPYMPRDLERAKKLLEEAGYPGGRGLPELVYEMSGADAVNRNGAEILKSSCADIGIRLKLNSQTWSQFLDKVRTKNAQIYGMAWLADYPDAENFLQLFYGPNSSPGPNNTNYQNPAYDELYEQMKVMQPGADRDAIIQDMVAIVNEDCPWSYTDYRVQYTYVQEWLRNFKYHPMTYWPIKYYDVDKDAKSRRLGRKSGADD